MISPANTTNIPGREEGSSRFLRDEGPEKTEEERKE
jgi:hypothetical protein